MPITKEYMDTGRLMSLHRNSEVYVLKFISTCVQVFICNTSQYCGDTALVCISRCVIGVCIQI
jgi:hypothetical protein